MDWEAFADEWRTEGYLVPIGEIVAGTRPYADVEALLGDTLEVLLARPLSNGSFALLTEMAKRARLPWDCILSTELFSAYKPDPRTYEGAAGLLGLAPEEVMLVAAHVGDLRAAASAGLRTGYVPRPLEWGPGGRQPAAPEPDFDVVAQDFGALADRLCSAEAER